jgi:hypothetical protein
MNISLKKNGLLLTIILSIYSVSYSQERRKPQRTVIELTEIAKKYGMEAMVPALKNSTLLYDDMSQVEQYFQKQSIPYKMNLEYIEFSQKTGNIRTQKEYFDLMDKYPLMKKGFMEAHKWDIKAYNEYVNNVAKVKWRIYRDKFGGVSFYKADTKVAKSELSDGQRIDNLPKE